MLLKEIWVKEKSNGYMKDKKMCYIYVYIFFLISNMIIVFVTQNLNGREGDEKKY